MPADIILKNANVITMDMVQPTARLVAITGDKISLVGDMSELESAVGAGTRIIDCEGKTVVPGFNDAHCHFFSLVRKLLSLDLSPQSVKTIVDIKLAIQSRLKDIPKGQWLEGTGFNDFYLAEKRFPNRWEIDEVSPDHPVVLSHRSLHACVLNSRALSLAGINSDTPEPPGAIIERDPSTGEPNGVLYEMLGYIREKVMPQLSMEALDNGVVLANRYYLSNGITSIQDATVTNDFKRWQSFGRFKKDGKLSPHICMMTGVQAYSQFQELGLISGYCDKELRLGAVKIMLNDVTAVAELSQQILDCHQAGFQLAFHAIEEKAVAAAVNALEYVDSHSPVRGRRHRVEHCAECTPYLLERLGRLGIIIVTQPPFIYYSGERYLATVAASQLPWLYRIKSPLDCSLIVAGSSDSPVVPGNPMVGIYAAVTRRAESGQVLLPNEAISPSRALLMYTVNAAYASFEEGIKGTVTAGKLADIVVLSDDPTRLSPERIKDIRVEMTIIGGRVVWEA